MKEVLLLVLLIISCGVALGEWENPSLKYFGYYTNNDTDYEQFTGTANLIFVYNMVFNGVTLVDTTNTYTNKETSHPPCYYFHPDDLKMEYFKRDTTKKTFCEWKGICSYWDLEVNGKVAKGVGFSYEDPTPQYQPIKGWLSFYPGPMDGCYVDGEKVTPEPAAYYSGWITKDIVGPFRNA